RESTQSTSSLERDAAYSYFLKLADRQTTDNSMASTRRFAVALLVIFTLNTFLLHTESVSCCLSYTKRQIHCQRMKGYTIQTVMSICDMDAIIFHTNSGKFVCADPAKKQTQETIQCLSARAKSIA
ncbi:hypothetical protein AAFF_G00013820, partial [Aldrovandia affinis]